MDEIERLSASIKLPCGLSLPNRLAKVREDGFRAFDCGYLGVTFADLLRSAMDVGCHGTLPSREG